MVLTDRHHGITQLRSSYFYHDFLAKKLVEPDSDPIENLENYSIRFYEQSKKIALKAIEATKGINECVY